MKSLKRWFAVSAATLAMASIGMAQDAAKKPLTVHGKVQGVNVKEGTVKLDNEKVEGWMDKMVMDYKVDNPEILKTLKPGDSITATVYAGDMELHKVKAEKK